MKNPRVSRRKEILKIRAEINEKEAKEAIVKIKKPNKLANSTPKAARKGRNEKP